LQDSLVSDYAKDLADGFLRFTPVLLIQVPESILVSELMKAEMVIESLASPLAIELS